MLNGLDLFSGIGGLSIALSDWVRPVTYCENDRYAQSVLGNRMWDGKITNAPIWDDVRTLTAATFEEATPIDIIYGGFPCQDISVAGSGAGLEGERSGLFFEIVRIVGDIQPAFVFLENVPAITTRGGVRVITEFARLGYDCRWTVVSAAEVGAPHLRRRWFLLAHCNDRLSVGENREIQAGRNTPDNGGQDVADSESERCREEGRLRQEQSAERSAGGGETLADAPGTQRSGCPREGVSGEGRPSFGPMQGGWWSTEPDVGRVANGVRARVDRIRGLGNAVIPLQAQTAFKRLIGLE